jgi:hypothetical protein
LRTGAQPRGIGADVEIPDGVAGEVGVAVGHQGEHPSVGRCGNELRRFGNAALAQGLLHQQQLDHVAPLSGHLIVDRQRVGMGIQAAVVVQHIRRRDDAYRSRSHGRRGQQQQAAGEEPGTGRVHTSKVVLVRTCDISRSTYKAGSAGRQAD